MSKGVVEVRRHFACSAAPATCFTFRVIGSLEEYFSASASYVRLVYGGRYASNAAVGPRNIVARASVAANG